MRLTGSSRILFTGDAFPYSSNSNAIRFFISIACDHHRIQIFYLILWISCSPMMAGDDGEKSCKNVKNGKFIRKKEHTEKTERLDKANMRVPIGTTYGSSWRMLKYCVRSKEEETKKKNSWANIFVPFKITFSCLQHLFFVCFYESESIELYLFDVVLFYSMVVNGFILGCVFFVVLW